MEKKLLAIIFVIGMIVYTIVQVVVFLLPFILIGGILLLLFRCYGLDPDGVAYLGSRLITPLLIIGWLYFIYILIIYPTYWTTLVYWGLI